MSRIHVLEGYDATPEGYAGEPAQHRDVGRLAAQAARRYAAAVRGALRARDVRCSRAFFGLLNLARESALAESEGLWGATPLRRSSAAAALDRLASEVHEVCVVPPRRRTPRR